MAASTATDYTNSRPSDSGKFARVEMIRASTLAERHRNLLVAMLHRNRFGDELWMSTESICVVMGRVCYRRKIAETDARGRKLHSCEQISRRAVQRLIDEVVALGVLTQVYGDNEKVPYGGGVKFRHTATYRLNPDKLVPRKTYEEYVEERDRSRARNRQVHRQESHREQSQHEPAEVTPIRKPAQKSLPPAPVAPLPKREEPAAEHRSTERSLAREETTASHRLTRAERKALVSYFRGLANKKQEQKRQSAFKAAPGAYSRIHLPPERDPWQRILRALEQKVDRHSFDTWLKPTRYSGETDGVLYVEIPTPEFAHAREKYADLILDAIDGLALGLNDVKFVAPEFVPPASLTLTESELMDVVEKACQLLSTSTRPISIEDGIVALRIAGML